MKTKIIIIAVFAAAIFCFWTYLRPELVAAREAFLLFLWNGDYFASRMAVPGGFARYGGEFLLQFFKFISMGAAIYALLFTAMQWLSWVLLKRICRMGHAMLLFALSFLPAVLMWYLACDMDVAMTLQMAFFIVLLLMVALPEKQLPSLICSVVLVPVGYWLLGPVVLLLALYHLRWLREKGARFKVVVESMALALLFVACLIVSSKFVPYPLKELAKGIDYQMIEREKSGTGEELFYDYLQRQKAWNQIVEKAYESEPQSRACRNIVLLAKYYTKRCSPDELKQALLHPDKVLTSGAAAMMMSDLYFQMGFTTMAQRAAFEVMESTSNYNKSARELTRLVETNLIIGEYQVALKYISLLEDTLFYRNWALRMKAYALHPERIQESPQYGSLQKIYEETVDVFFF